MPTSGTWRWPVQTFRPNSVTRSSGPCSPSRRGSTVVTVSSDPPGATLTDDRTPVKGGEVRNYYGALRAPLRAGASILVATSRQQSWPGMTMPGGKSMLRARSSRITSSSCRGTWTRSPSQPSSPNSRRLRATDPDTRLRGRNGHGPFARSGGLFRYQRLARPKYLHIDQRRFSRVERRPRTQRGSDAQYHGRLVPRGRSARRRPHSVLFCVSPHGGRAAQRPALRLSGLGRRRARRECMDEFLTRERNRPYSAFLSISYFLK